MNPAINTNKYENAVLFFIKYCNNQYLGATKLNKLLYYLDFISVRDTGKSVTGDQYVNKQFGPVPENVDEVLTKLKAEGAIDVQKVAVKKGEMFKFETKRDPDLSVFDSHEQELLEKICQEFSLWKTDKIVNQTHLEAPWFYSKPYEVVDYKYAKSIEFFSA
jgi:uncharacterized phage-associated protein